MNKLILKKIKAIDARKNDEPGLNEKPVKIEMEMDDLAKLMVQEKPKKAQGSYNLTGANSSGSCDKVAVA